ncbi:MAG TPA: penicillin-binding protein 2 [Desulfobacteraceae bacterium]|nr:penicillin-binding protein 2 [Desulfobacteraceae bacterium]HPJ66531.1 penicillin-binding protein 2 [Desulfobacteraceae bacterium]HPQ29505.1 penicillin-binding protein 2 [Desulfobacteraceae bacterium]
MRKSDFDPVSVDIFNRQLQKATLLVLIIFGILLLRLWILQIVDGSTYRTKSENNRIRLHSISPFRGLIFDRHGELLVGNRPSYDLFVIPEEVQDRTCLLKSLNLLLGVDPEKAEEKLGGGFYRYPFRPVCLKRDISRNELAVIETQRFNLPGVMIKVTPQRDYIFGNFASHLLGYLGEINENQLKSGKYHDIRPGDLIGKSGIERRWQDHLNGIRGGEQVEVDAAGRKIQVISRKPPVSGENIYLTIDKKLQVIAENALNGKRGAILAMNPNGGEILALASSPSFNPNLFIGGIDKGEWEKISTSKDFILQNRALSGQYPPGSVFKIIVALAGLEEGVIDPEEELICTGSYSLGDSTYRCWKKYGHGKVNLYRAIVESCDVYFYKLGKRLGVDMIAHYAGMFGLGQDSGFDIGQSKEGLIPTSEWKVSKFGLPWQTGETISVSIGQSFVLITPMQAVSLISTVFNGGIVYVPQVVKRIGKSEAEAIHKFNPKVKRKVPISNENMKLVQDALTGVVNQPHGTGRMAKLNMVSVAGKTGTAQVVKMDKYSDDRENDKEVPVQFRDHAWFVAIAPTDEPRIAVSIIIEHGGHGGSAAAPIAAEMINSYLN